MKSILIVFVALTHSVFASNNWGLKAGANFSNGRITSSDANPPNLYGSTQIAGGLVLDTSLYDERWFFQTEVIYLGMGTSASAAGEVSTTWAYIAVPFLIKRRVYLSDQVTLFALAGPEFRSRVGSPAHATVKALDAAIDAGIGAEYNFSPSFGLMAELRYGYGLVNQLDAPSLPNTSIQGRGLQAYLGFLLPI